MSFSNSSVIVLTDAGAVHQFDTAQSSPYSITFPAGSTGTWTWIVSRAGYTCQSGTFDASTGGLVSASPSPTVRLQPNGSNMYTGTTDALVSISFDLTSGLERCFIDIGNGTPDINAIMDEIEDALETEDGCRFLAATACAECTLAELAAGDFLFMGTGYRVRRASAGDINATVPAFCISVDGLVVDGANGGVAFLSSNLSASDVADAVWGYIIESGFEAQELMRLLTSVAAGDATGLEGANPIFKDITGAKNRVTATYTSGSRVITELDAT
jgi:hypothetical protein